MSVRCAGLRFVTAMLCVAIGFAGCGGEAEPGTEGTPEILDHVGEGDDANQMVLDQLAAAGSDLSKPTDVRWYVYFENDGAAAAFTTQATAAGYEVERRRTEDDEALCMASQTTVPTLDRIRRMEAELTKFAGAGGTVDGWEAAIQR